MYDKRDKTLWKQVAETSSLGFLFAGCILIGLTMGHYIDKWLGTSPWFTLIFIFLGLAAGFYQIFKTALKTK